MSQNAKRVELAIIVLRIMTLQFTMHIRCIITSHVNTWPPSSYTINLVTTSQEMGKNLELYVTMIKAGDHEFLHLVIKSIQLTTCNLITLPMLVRSKFLCKLGPLQLTFCYVQPLNTHANRNGSPPNIHMEFVTH